MGGGGITGLGPCPRNAGFLYLCKYEYNYIYSNKKENLIANANRFTSNSYQNLIDIFRGRALWFLFKLSVK